MVIQMNKISIPADSLGLHSPHPLTMVLEDSRDPLEINKHLQPNWSSVIGEPEGLRSPIWAWKLSSEVFAFVQAATYRFLVVILGPLFSLIAALLFGLLHFLQIWVGRPILKFFHVVATFTRSFFELVLHGTIAPLLETLGMACSRIRVRHQRIYDARDEPTYPFVI